MSGVLWLETDTLANQNISSALAIGAYTATEDRAIVVQAFADQVAGSGDYVMYATLQIAGAGSAYVILPKTTMTAASGETAIAGQSGIINVRTGDVVTVYIDGLAGDTTTPDTNVRWFALDDVNVTAISGDSTAADNLEAMLDGTGGVTLTTAITGNITGNLSGSVGSLATQAKADVNAEVDSALADYDGPTKAELDAGLALLSTFDPSTDVIEGTVTWVHGMRLMASLLGAKVSGGGTTTISFRNLADTKDRVVMTVDENGNRSAVVLDLT